MSTLPGWPVIQALLLLSLDSSPVISASHRSKRHGRPAESSSPGAGLERTHRLEQSLLWRSAADAGPHTRPSLGHPRIAGDHVPR